MIGGVGDGEARKKLMQGKRIRKNMCKEEGNERKVMHPQKKKNPLRSNGFQFGFTLKGIKGEGKLLIAKFGFPNCYRKMKGIIPCLSPLCFTKAEIVLSRCG